MKKSQLRQIIRESIREIKSADLDLKGEYSEADAFLFSGRFAVNPEQYIKYLKDIEETLIELDRGAGLGPKTHGYKQPSQAALEQGREGEYDNMAPITDMVLKELKETALKIKNLITSIEKI